MTYINTGNMLREARLKGYVVGAFNIVDLTSMEAVIEAAIEKSSPMIIQTSQKTVEEMGFEMPPRLVRSLSAGTSVPIAMNLDHGTDIDIIKRCIDYGWSSVMIDGSSKPFEENVKITRQIVEYAHQKGVTVEGELGHIGGSEEDVKVRDDKVLLTEPIKAKEFQKLTGVDSLAVAIGTRHGHYRGQCRLDFPRLARIMELCPFPIVIHGCSDLPPDELKKIISYNPSKMNISTELKHAYLDAYKKYIDRSHKRYTQDNIYEYEPLKAIRMVKGSIRELVGSYIEIFGSEGRPPIRRAG